MLTLKILKMLGFEALAPSFAFLGFGSVARLLTLNNLGPARSARPKFLDSVQPLLAIGWRHGRHRREPVCRHFHERAILGGPDPLSIVHVDHGWEADRQDQK